MIELILIIISSMICITLGILLLRIILIGIGIVLTFAAPILIMIGLLSILTTAGVI